MAKAWGGMMVEDTAAGDLDSMIEAGEEMVRRLRVRIEAAVDIAARLSERCEEMEQAVECLRTRQRAAWGAADLGRAAAHHLN